MIKRRNLIALLSLLSLCCLLNNDESVDSPDDIYGEWLRYSTGFLSVPGYYGFRFTKENTVYRLQSDDGKTAYAFFVSDSFYVQNGTIHIRGRKNSYYSPDSGEGIHYYDHFFRYRASMTDENTLAINYLDADLVPADFAVLHDGAYQKAQVDSFIEFQ